MKKTIALILMLCLLLTLFPVTSTADAATPVLRIAAHNIDFADSVYLMYAVESSNCTGGISLLVWTSPQESYTHENAQATITRSKKETINDREYDVFEFTGLVAKQMTDDVFVCAYTIQNDTDYYSPVDKYSILEYAYSKLGKIDPATATNNEALHALLESMLVYGANAQVYGNYKTDHLATYDYYQINVVGGTLDNGFTTGLYNEDETITISAPETNGSGETFSYWVDSGKNKVGTSPILEFTGATANQTYTAVYGNSVNIMYSGELENIAWQIDDSGCLTITGNGGAMPVISSDSQWLAHRAEIKSCKIENISSISEEAFLNCENMTQITIPSTVISIHETSFIGCDSLVTIYGVQGSAAETLADEMIVDFISLE